MIFLSFGESFIKAHNKALMPYLSFVKLQILWGFFSLCQSQFCRFWFHFQWIKNECEKRRNITFSLSFYLSHSLFLSCYGFSRDIHNKNKIFKFEFVVFFSYSFNNNIHQRVHSLMRGRWWRYMTIIC